MYFLWGFKLLRIKIPCLKTIYLWSNSYLPSLLKITFHFFLDYSLDNLKKESKSGLINKNHSYNIWVNGLIIFPSITFVHQKIIIWKQKYAEYLNNSHLFKMS